MARYTLKNAIFKSGSDVVDGLRQIDVEENVGDTDLTAAGDAAQSHQTLIPGWTASATFLHDNDAGANQTLRAGDSITFNGYTEGDGTGKKYLTGTASVLSVKWGGSYDGEAGFEVSLKGNGALSISTVV